MYGFAGAGWVRLMCRLALWMVDVSSANSMARLVSISIVVGGVGEIVRREV